MNDLQIFNSEEFGEIRTITINNEPWFVGKDVAEALGYKNTKDAIGVHVANEDKRIIQRSEIATIENYIPKKALPVNFVSGDIPNRGLTAINESGLYALIFGSKLESAKRFKHWVTSEVLPSIRKTGRYGVPKTPSEQIQLIAQGYVELEHTVNGIKDDVADLKDNMPLYGCEIDEVSNHVKRRVVNVLGGKDSEAYKDSSVRGQVFSDIYTQIKREYGLVSSYKSIKRKYLADVHDFIDCYELPRYLEEQINECNAQMRIGGM